MADDQLVTALHTKYYSDIPIDQFNQKIGFQSVQPVTPIQPIEQKPLVESQPAFDQQPVDSLSGQEIDNDLIRHDGTLKGSGFRGILKNSLGQDVTEYSIGVNIGGKEVDIPTVIPNLTDDELNIVLEASAGNGELPDSIIEKAALFAKDRIESGKSPFYVSGDLGQKLPKDKSMLELVGDKLENWGAGLGERAGDLGGALLQTIQTTGEGLEQKAPMGGFAWGDGDVLPSYKSPEEWAATDAPQILTKGAEALKGVDLGYEEKVNWQNVKDAFTEGGPLSGSAYANVLEYGIEQGVKSIPDMVATVFALPPYILARSGEIGEQRAINKGKSKADLEDILEAAPFAAASALLERVGAKGMTSDLKADLGKELLKAGIKNQVKRVAKSGGKALSKEAATEAVQEGMIEYVGEKFGTDAKMDFMEALDRAAAGAVAGGVIGGGIGTGTATVNEINYSPEKVLARAMEEELTRADTAIAEDTAVDLLDPERAQLEQTGTTPKIETSNLETSEAWKKLTAEEKAKFNEVIEQSDLKPTANIKGLPIDKAVMPEQEPVALDIPKGEEVVKQQVTGLDVVEAPISEISISKDVPQFKEGANVKGVVEPLGGEFERTGVAPIQIWVREDGRKEVISGRHRLDLAERSGEKTIPAQYHYESEGFGADQAAVLDAMLNIREGQGKVKDYVDFIKATKPRKEEAKSQGILARQTGKRAFTIATEGSDALVTSHRNDQLTDEAATRIAEAAPRNEALQAVGIKAIQEGKTIAVAENLVKAVKSMTDETQQQSGDLIGKKIEDAQYKLKDNKPVKPGERIFHAPGHNFIGLFRSTGIPERRDFVYIEGRKLNIPDQPQRIEPIISKLVEIMGRRIYFGKIKGKSSEGFYRPSVGEIRTRKKNDVEVLAHEMAHYLDFYSNITLPNFKNLYKDPRFVDEVKALSYTDADNAIMEIEGFAEFVRLWLTNSPEALIRAPRFYEAFTNLMARDRKLLNPMRDMQDLMHKFYFQGPDKLGQALIGKDTSFKQRFDEWAYRRDSRIRQQTIDRFHAARKVEQELTRKIGNVQESAWKQFRLSNGGSEGISDYVMNYGTVNFDDNGDLQRTGVSLHEVLQPVKSIKLKPEHKGDQKIDLLLRYFAGRRALELHRQGRENLIPKETAKEWARLGKDYPIFESIQKEYQAFNDRMMDFYQESGMITPEGRATMGKMNKDYVPFNRIREQLAGGPTGVGGGFNKLKGGTANLNDILVNIQDGITANVRSALDNRAKQRLYQYIAGHKDGSIFATKIATDSKPVQVYAEEMQSKIGKVLEANGIVVDGDIELVGSDLLTFWQHGVKPQLNESGNIVDSVVINGKPSYYEVQDPLLQEMLLSMNPESYSSFMNVMFGIKNFFTRTITLGVEFTGANLVRDTVGATFISKNNFIPFISSFQGMYSFIARDIHYQNFIKGGGGYSSRIEAQTKEGTARRRVKLDEFGVMSVPEKLLSTIDNIASAFEYGTRIGEFRLAKKNMKSDMDAGFEAREISTDFSVLGANRFLTGYIRTVPFLNAMIQSQDRVFREAAVVKKYDGNPAAMAMKAFLGITVPTLVLYMVNKDDEDYKAIPDYEKRTNWHIKIGPGQFVKIPRPYDVGFVYATMPELFFKYIEDTKGREFADGMMWTLTQMYGIDGVPAMMTGWWDLVRNEKWTGAPVVPSSLSDVEATEQYSSNTAETFIRMGEALGISPVKAEHMFKAYTGYLGGYLLWGTDHMLWDEEKFGEKPESKSSDNIFLRRFLTPDVRPATAAMEKFFDLKEKSDKIVSTFKQQTDVRRAIKGQLKDGSKFKGDRFFGLSGKEKEVLFALNDSMNQLIKLMYGKEGIKTAELKVKHNKKLTGEQKRKELDRLWNSRNDAFMKYYLQADKALQKAKQESDTFKKMEK